jgi:hypothetical protein
MAYLLQWEEMEKQNTLFCPAVTVKHSWRQERGEQVGRLQLLSGCL